MFFASAQGRGGSYGGQKGSAFDVKIRDLSYF
jgi:hypothetical protein